MLVSAECLFFSLRFPWFWQAWFSVETWAFWYYITRLQISFKLVLAAFPGTALLRWVGALLLTVEVEAQASPGALRTPEGWLLSSLLGSGVGGSLSPCLVHWGPWRCDPPVGREDPSASAALSTLAGPLWASAVLGGVELFCLQLLRGSSPDALTGARRLRWGLAGTWAAGESAPGLRSQAREAPGPSTCLWPRPSASHALSRPRVLSRDRLSCRGERGPCASPSSRWGPSLLGTHLLSRDAQPLELRLPLTFYPSAISACSQDS